MKILDVPLKRPVAVVIIFSLLAFLGVMEYRSMKYELTPPMAMTYLYVQTIYPGASPQEVEDQVSKKLEDAVSGIARVKHVTTQSLENASVILLEFESGTDVNIAAQDVQRQVNATMSDLPSAVKTPMVNKFSMDDYPIIQLAITSSAGKGDFYELVKDTVKPRLGRISGVGQVTMLGGNAREVRVSLSQTKLERYGIPILLVMQKIGAANLDFPAGSIKDVDGEYVVRIAGKLKNLDEMRDLVLTSLPGAGSVRLGDVAKIEDTLADSDTIFRYNGKEAIGLQILKQSGANAVDVSEKVHAELSKMEKEFKAQGLRFEIAQDSSVFTLGSARDVVDDIILAILFVGVIMLLFLHDFRNSFIVMMAIPTTLLTTFIGMGVGGFTLNLLSLLALTLVIGILVDDSIVVIENIHRHRALGESAMEAAAKGTREIAFAASSVTLVIIVAFLPVSLAGGMIGAMLIQFGLTIVMATAISLFVSFFLTPLLAAKMGGSETKSTTGAMARFGRAFDRGFSGITKGFLSVFDWAVKHKGLTIVAAFLFFVFSMFMLATGLVGSEFMVKIDRGEFNISLELPERTSLEQNDGIVQGIEKDLRARPEVDRIYTKVGYSSMSSSSYKTSINVGLVPRKSRHKSSEQVGREVEAAIRGIPGVKVTVEQVGIIDMGSSTSPISYTVSGQNYEHNLAVAKAWADVMRTVQGTGDVRLSASDGRPELKIDIDRGKLADLGLSLDSVGSSLRTALAGNDSLYYKEGGVDYTIRILLDSFDRTSTAQVASLSFANNQGRQIRLSQFATIQNGFGPTVLTRLDRESSITVSGQAIGRTSGEIDKEIRAEAAKLTLPSDVTVKPSGMLTMQSDSFGSLGFALLLSLILIYAILAILFDSLTYPLSVMFSLPFAMIGGFFSLALTKLTLNVYSIMAMILLIGLAAKNAILLLDRALKNHQDRDMGIVEALREAVSTRIRPIFMTTAAMVVGMLPLALGMGSAGEMKKAMGMVLIGGLIFGLLITMILVPVAFLAVESLRTRFMRAKKNTTEIPNAQ
jgi:hydrophobic/amphiphilic exporter-1 (mainly G- bacteria), HAE1 family